MKYDNEAEFGKLAKELATVPRSDPNYQQIQRIISDLWNGEYHDFANDKYATPKLQMIADFEAIGRPDVVARIKNGDFDQ